MITVCVFVVPSDPAVGSVIVARAAVEVLPETGEVEVTVTIPPVPVFETTVGAGPVITVSKTPSFAVRVIVTAFPSPVDVRRTVEGTPRDTGVGMSVVSTGPDGAASVAGSADGSAGGGGGTDSDEA